jgi:uncharacterized protein (TIGR03083 family)
MTSAGLKPQRIDPRKGDPFPSYDREIRRLRRQLQHLDAAGWRAPSYCRGWSVKDVVAHLCTNEVYNEACLDGTLDRLDFTGGLHAWNARGVQARRHLLPRAVLAEWMRRQRGVRRRWGQIGLRGKIHTSVGSYPLRLQVWHLAREYAIHADDIRVAVPARARAERWRWRVSFAFFTAREEGEPLRAHWRDGMVRLEHGGRVFELDLEAFIAYHGNRPQHLGELTERRLLRRLGRRG